MKIQMTASQKESFAKLEKVSFLDHCRELQRDPGEFADLLLTIDKRTIQAQLAQLDQLSELQPGRVEGAKKFYRPFLAASDWWSYKRVQNAYYIEEYSGAIASRQRELPIHWEYLSRLSRRLGIEPPGDDRADWIREFLKAIPHVLIYGTEFNAFVGHETAIDDIPCVGIYGLLVPAVEAFLNVSFRFAFEPTTSQKVFIVPPERAREIGQTPELVDALEQVLEMVLARRDLISLDPAATVTASWPLMGDFYRSAAEGARHFVSFHEYGHLLMGHLEVSAGHRVEFEADGFAWKVKPERSLSRDLGALVVLVLIALIEIINQVESSPTHPRAQDRINQLLVTAGREDQVLLMHHLSSLLSLCQFVVEKRFGRTFSLGG